MLLLRVSIGIIFILICGPALLGGESRWWHFGSAMRALNFHAHLDWWGFFGALAGCIGAILMVLGLAFRLGILLVFLIAVINAVAVSQHDHSLGNTIIPVEVCVILIALSFLGPGKYSVDKN